MNAILCFTVLIVGQTTEPLRFHNADERREIIARLHADVADKLPMGRLTQEQGEAILTVALLAGDTKKPGPAMIGTYERKGTELIFTPRFPLDAGQTYRADLQSAGKTATLIFQMPKAAAKTPPKVVKIYPSADVLPANQLRFYIYFDRPMRGGKDLFKQIALVDDKGKEIHDPWLLDEIWDEANNCLILYIHPGRIKWGVLLRELLGPVLVEKREYSLVIRGEWADTEGNKIGKDFVKKFRTTAEDRSRIELSDWKLLPPRAGSGERLYVTFPKCIDFRSLQRFITITDAKGHRVDGQFEIGKHEKEWTYIAKNSWPEGQYHLEIEGELEDVAGNTPLRPFDFDLKAKKLPPQNLKMKFKCLGD
jgi:hypothetical protein